MVRTFLVLTAALGLGCNEKPGAEARKQGGSATPATAVDAGRAGATGSTIKLPPPSGKTPRKTSTPLLTKNFEELSKLGLESFTSDVRATDNALSVRHELKNRPKIGVHVLIQPCNDKLPCRPMEVDKWSKEELRKFIVKPIRNAPDLTFDMGITDLEGGAKAIFTYELGYLSAPDPESGGEVRTQYLNGYVLYYNDGINQMRVATFYADDTLPSKAALAKAVPREHLERIGKSMIDFYGQAWAGS